MILLNQPMFSTSWIVFALLKMGMNTHYVQGYLYLTGPMENEPLKSRLKPYSHLTSMRILRLSTKNQVVDRHPLLSFINRPAVENLTSFNFRSENIEQVNG